MGCQETASHMRTQQLQNLVAVAIALYPIVLCFACLAPYGVKPPYRKVMMIKLPSRERCALGASRGDSIANCGSVSH